MSPKLLYLLHYVAPQVPSSLHLRIAVASADFAIYARKGEPLIGCGWRKSPEFMYPADMTERAWHSVTHRIWMAHQPWWARWGGRALALVVLAGALR